MSWLRRLLLLAGLVTGAWLLGGAGQANADIRVEIDRLEIEVELPVVDIGLRIETTSPRPEAPVPPKPDPRAEPPAPPAALQEALPPVEAPARPEATEQRHVSTPPSAPPTTAHPTRPEPVPHQPQPQPQPQPQAEQPVPGTLPQSGAGSSNGNQIPAGTLPHVTRPPATTASPVDTGQQDVPHTVRAEEPTFSPD